MDFQTPTWCCDFMVSLVQEDENIVLEPTAGEGNLVHSLKQSGKSVLAPVDFYTLDFENSYDCIVMNPPFSPMTRGYQILDKCMLLAEHVIALMPWLTIINSEKRTKKIIDWGLKGIYHLPRRTFPGSRVQTCVLDMVRGSHRDAIFKSIPFPK